MLDRLRGYFRAAGVLEVCTPALGSCTVTDPNIESISAVAAFGRAYLQTSPEYFMKRLLAAGYPDIFQVSQVFRDGEAGRLHAPEFTMIEWYRHRFGLQQIIDDAVGLTLSLLQRRKPAGVEQLSYRDAFERQLGLDPLDAGAMDIADAIDAEEALRAAIGDDRDAWLDLALATRIAPAFANDRLIVLHHYPASQAALARLATDDPRVAERFELFVGGTEIANGFVELADADEQRRRFAADRQKRLLAGRPVPGIDEHLIQALESGLPDCAGVALGLDRVLMIDEGHDDIRRVQSFTTGDMNEN
jgi:lysyl-tRNA synthetase class 2